MFKELSKGYHRFRLASSARFASITAGMNRKKYNVSVVLKNTFCSIGQVELKTKLSPKICKKID